MGNFDLLMQGFGTSFSVANVLLAIAGGFMGLLVGAMPGIGAVTGVALLLPLTFKMDPTSAIIMLAGIYYGNMYGGAYSAILLNIPGDSPAVMTALDGYPLSRQGKGGKALFAANISSFIGGSIGIVTLTLFGPLLAKVGLKFGPAEIAALILLALTSIGVAPWGRSIERYCCFSLGYPAVYSRHGFDGWWCWTIYLRFGQPAQRFFLYSFGYRDVRASAGDGTHEQER